MKFVIALLIGIGASILVAPVLATNLQWPLWIIYIVVAVDGILIVDAPRQFSEFFANERIRQRAFFSQFADGRVPSFLNFILGGLAPVLVLFWLHWQFLS